MGLIKCKECGAEVSEMAKSCPKCGCPINDSSDGIRVNINKKLIKRMAIIVVMVVLVIVFGKGFIHPNLKFEDLVFKTSKVKRLLGYCSGINERDNYYWDDCIKFYDIPVKHLEYTDDYDGWYYFYFEERYSKDVYKVIKEHCYSTYFKGLYDADHDRLAVWVDGIEEIGEYKGLFLIKVNNSENR